MTGQKPVCELQNVVAQTQALHIELNASRLTLRVLLCGTHAIRTVARWTHGPDPVDDGHVGGVLEEGVEPIS